MADEGPSDELVSQFLAVTGSADASRAVSYLEMSGGDLEMAVGLYMEHTPNEMGGGGGGTSMMGGSPQIRAPDATRTMRLMDDTDMIPTHPAYHLMSAMMDEAVVGSAFASPPIHHHRHLDARAVINAAAAADSKEDDDDDDDDDEFKEDGNDDDDSDVQMVSATAAAAPVPKRLADMFAAPTHLIHNAGGFQGARTTAKDARRWLLVNIQRDSEFSCHALNRDVWRDELVENLIREGFIFWQTFDTSTEGQTYAERYQVHDYPHVAIIDPRTARLMWRREGWTQQNPMTAETFAEAAMDFCSRHTFSKPPVAPRPVGDGASAAASRPSKRSMQEMSEDEQLQAAMQASLGAAAAINDDDDDDDDIQCLGTQTGNLKQDDEEEEGTAAAEVVKEDQPPSFVEQLLAIPLESEEPADGARIQFRMPDGKRVVRKFSPSAAVKTIYAFVAQTNEEARSGREFWLMAGFPPSDLINSIDDTIESCKLAGQAITVRWKS